MFFFYFSLILIPHNIFGLKGSGNALPSVTCPNKLPLLGGYIEWTDEPEKFASVEWMYSKVIESVMYPQTLQIFN